MSIIISKANAGVKAYIIFHVSALYVLAVTVLAVLQLLSPDLHASPYGFPRNRRTKTGLMPLHVDRLD